MREIHVDEIRDNVAQICIDAAYNVSEDVLAAFDRAMETEAPRSGARTIIELLKENARIARDERIPVCQDTGIAIFFVEIGQDLRIKNGFIVDAVNEGVRKGYREGSALIQHEIHRLWRWLGGLHENGRPDFATPPP